MCNFKACNSIKKETLAQVFSCEFCKISKNVFTEHLRATDSGSIERLVTCGLRAHLQDYYCKKIRFFFQVPGVYLFEVEIMLSSHCGCIAPTNLQRNFFFV